jgi:hypothetical protein
MALGSALALGACGPQTATNAAAVAGTKVQEAQQAKQPMDVLQAQIQIATEKIPAHQKALQD